jgi:uncharacterized protein (DUF1810 family)
VADLERFRDAQASPDAGLTALRELERGRKAGHWIWYIFPQLAGLGRSPMAIHYGIADAEEAAAYLRDPALGERLVRAAAAVRAHLAGPRPPPLNELMGSEIDARKLISCMTLFGHVAAAMAAGPAPVHAGSMADHAAAILTSAGAQGYRRCGFTEHRLRGAGGGREGGAGEASHGG